MFKNCLRIFLLFSQRIHNENVGKLIKLSQHCRRVRSGWGVLRSA